jgi:two-component system sensor histidine kinase HydH
MNKPLAAKRTARWGLLITSLVLGLTLIGTAYLGHRSAFQVAETAALGQASVFVHSLRHRLDPRAGPPPQEILEGLLADHNDLGLRYVALVDDSGGVVVEAGKPVEDPIQRDSKPGGGRRIVRIGDRYRLLTRPPPRGRPHWRPRDTARGRNKPRPQFLLEFEPTLSRQLQSRATTTLAVSAAAGLVLMGAAVVFWRFSLRADATATKLEHQRRLAALGEMSAVLAHELRNPLGSLKGHAQLLGERLPENSPEQAKADQVVDEAVRLERLSNDLLDFVRSNRVEKTPLDPGGLLRQSADAVDRERIDLELDEAPETWPLDAPRMQQALTNLLRNALQASPPGTRVQARVGVAGSQLVFTVQDAGDGIPPGEEDHIFEPFHTQRVRGVGLGLAVARRVVELHGGKIRASNRPKGGAEFRVTIPKQEPLTG